MDTNEKQNLRHISISTKIPALVDLMWRNTSSHTEEVRRGRGWTSTGPPTVLSQLLHDTPQCFQTNAGMAELGKAFLVQAQIVHTGSRRLRLPGFPISTGHLYASEGAPSKHSVTGWVDPTATVRPEGLNQGKISKTQSGTEPATLWLVEQCLNQLRHRVARYKCRFTNKRHWSAIIMRALITDCFT
jgi:hypothetical protein